jgi:hypothetical protein
MCKSTKTSKLPDSKEGKEAVSAGKYIVSYGFNGA